MLELLGETLQRMEGAYPRDDGVFHFSCLTVFIQKCEQAVHIKDCLISFLNYAAWTVYAQFIKAFIKSLNQ